MGDYKFDLLNEIEHDKQRYIKAIKQGAYDKVVIYGAGRMAKPLYLFLKSQDIHVDAFCVSDASINKKDEYGVPIIAVDKLPYEKEETIFLFGVNPRLNEEIKKELDKKGFIHYIEATEYIRYYGDYQYRFFTSPMLEITTKMGCAVNCKFCPQELLLKNYFKTGKEDKILSFEKFKACIDKTPMNTIIEFAGFTEPFFNPECRRMILYANETGRTVNVFTTLRGCAVEDINAIKHINFGEFVVHVPDIEGYANIPITEEYLQVLDTVINVKKANGDSLMDYACSQGEIPSVIKEHLGDNVRVFISLHDRAGNLDDENLFHARDIKGRIRCELSQTIDHNIMLPDGRVVLCTQDYGMKHVLGNLYEQDYEEVVNGEEANKVKKCMESYDDNSVLCRNCHVARNY